MRAHGWRWLGLMATAATLALLGGCAATIPEAIRTAPATSPTPAEVRANPQRYLGDQVRWGGTIASVENGPQQTWMEIVARDLKSNGRPESGDASRGRFLARLEGFYDPAIYAVGRQITVVGTLQKPTTRRIGQYPYRFPVVKVTAHYLWESEVYRPAYYDPFWYDPWYPYPYAPYHWPYGPYW